MEELTIKKIYVGKEGLHPKYPHDLEDGVVWKDEEGNPTFTASGRINADIDYSRCKKCGKQFYIGGRDSECKK